MKQIDSEEIVVTDKDDTRSTLAFTKSARQLLTKFLGSRRTASGNFNDDLAVIATKECMEQLAGGYLLSMKKQKRDYYAHSSQELYFNKIIKILVILRIDVSIN